MDRMRGSMSRVMRAGLRKGNRNSRYLECSGGSIASGIEGNVSPISRWNSAVPLFEK